MLHWNTSWLSLQVKMLHQPPANTVWPIQPIQPIQFGSISSLCHQPSRWNNRWKLSSSLRIGPILRKYATWIYALCSFSKIWHKRKWIFYALKMWFVSLTLDSVCVTIMTQCHLLKVKMLSSNIIVSHLRNNIQRRQAENIQPLQRLWIRILIFVSHKVQPNKNVFI